VIFETHNQEETLMDKPSQRNSQQQIEMRYEQVRHSVHARDQIMSDVFGPVEDWTLEIGPYQLVLMPVTGEWLYLHPLYGTWERTGYKAGEIHFYLQGNLLEGQAVQEEQTAQPEQPAQAPPPTPPAQPEESLESTLITALEDQQADVATMITEAPRIWQLIRSDETQQDQPFTLGQQTRLGRVADNEIVLADPQASRHHATIEWTQDNYWLSDLDSKNGTYLNGERLEQPIQIKPGDQIRIGSTLFTVWLSD
jgi:hypothetical protein